MNTVEPQGLLSPSDIAELAGVNRPLVSNWRKRYDDFPTPVAGTDAKPLFERQAVEAWLSATGRPINRPVDGALWAGLHAARGLMSTEEAAELVLSVTTLRSVCEETGETAIWRAVADATPDAVSGQLRAAMYAAQPDLPVSLGSRRGVGDPRLAAAMYAIVRAVGELQPDQLANAADATLERFARSQLKGGAEHGFIGSRTSALLVNLAASEPGTVYDVACGIGTVLVALGDNGNAKRLVGDDVSEAALRIAGQRALLHGVDVDLRRADPLLQDPRPDLAADVVVAEPPFGLRWDPSKAVADRRFVYGVPSQAASDLAWVEHAVAHLTDAGTAYVLTAPAALFRSGADREVRSALVSAGCVRGVVGLPPKMLPHTSIALALWVLQSPSPMSDVLLVDGSQIDDIEERVAGFLAEPEPAVPHTRVPIQELLAADANLSPSRWVAHAAPDVGVITAEFTSASAAVDDCLEALRGVEIDLSSLAELAPARLSTVAELDRTGVLKWKRGRPTEAPERVRHADVRMRILPDGAAREHSDDPARLTEPGDVLLTTTGEIYAMVDNTGGHLSTQGVDVLRPLDTSSLNPAYLALMVGGEWNRRHRVEATIPRFRVSDLEIPLLPIDQQEALVRVLGDVDEIRRLATALDGHAGAVTNAIRDGIRFDVPLPAVSEQAVRTTDEREQR